MLIGGLEWIVSAENPGPHSNAIVTLSTYKRSDLPNVAGPTGTVESAIRGVLANNITVIASANNQNGDACHTSPGRLSINNPDPLLRNDVITVGGSMLVNRPWMVDLSDVAGSDVHEADGGGARGPEPAYDQTRAVRDARWICGAGDSAISCSNALPTSTADPVGSSSAYTGFNGGSNAGPCVTLFTPAKNIFVASTGSLNSYRDARLRGANASGTSWSAPIAAGFAARVLQANPAYGPAQVRAKLLENTGAGLDAATLNTYTYSSTGTGTEITGTPNKLLHLADVNVVTNPVSTQAAPSGPTALSFEAGSTSGSALSYQWYQVNPEFDIATYDTGAFSSVLIPGARENDFLAPATTSTTAFWARVTNSCGSADTAIAVVVPRPAAPTGVNAFGDADGAVTVSWSAAVGAETYEIQRKMTGQPWTVAGTVPASIQTFSETPPTDPGATMAVYRVLSIAGGNYLPPGEASYSVPSHNDFANLRCGSYEELTVPPFATSIKAQHVIELRAAVNALCEAVGVAKPYDDDDLQVSALQGELIRAADFTSLMIQINEIRGQSVFGLAPGTFTEDPVTGLTVKRSQVESLRDALN
jgi:hypothetical protein